MTTRDKPITGQTVTFFATFPGSANNVHLYLRPTTGPGVQEVTVAEGNPGEFSGKWIAGAGGAWISHWEGTVGTDHYVAEEVFPVDPAQVVAP